MKPFWIFTVVFSLLSFSVSAEGTFRIKGFCIGAPDKTDVDEFVTIIEKELAPAGVNTLILRVDFGYRYQTHPELVSVSGI